MRLKEDILELCDTEVLVYLCIDGNNGLRGGMGEVKTEELETNKEKEGREQVEKW